MSHSEHLSKQFDSDLEDVRSRVLQMGGLVEAQILAAIECFTTGDHDKMAQVVENEFRVNAYEVEIDDMCVHVVARRQPTASDLRLIMGVSKAVTDLERMGDEAEKIARMVKSIIRSGSARALPSSELRIAAGQASTLLRKALDAFARLDVDAAVSIIRDDDEIDREFDGFVRKLITYMMEDPRTISPSLDLLFLAKAIERIGDHAKNVAEFIIYIVKGTDVRHTAIEQIDGLNLPRPGLIILDVRIDPEEATDLASYRAKYRRYPQYVAPMLTPDVRETTIKLAPRHD